MHDAMISGGFNGPIAINEFRFTATADFRFTSNFVELRTEPDATFEGLTLLVINGEAPNGSSDNIGQITWAVDLSEAVADEDGYLLIGTEDLATFDAGDIFVEGFNPNGNAQTILVVRDFTGAVGDDLDIDDNGTIDTPPYSEIIVGLGLVDEDRDRNVLYAEDVVQADPLDPGFISAGAARQPDFNGAFVTLPYDTPHLDTPGYANVAPEEPAFTVQMGTDLSDVLRGLDDVRNLLVGMDGSDRVIGGNDADLIIGGLGSDRIYGAGGDDIIVAQGGGRDVAFGGEGADVFKLSGDYTSNGTRDKLVIRDYDPTEDMLDLTGAHIASVASFTDRLVLRLVGETDSIVLRGITDFDTLVFRATDLPETGVSLDAFADLDADDEAVLTLTTQADGPRLVGSIEDDVFAFFGGESAVAYGNGGADTFILKTDMQDNGIADKIRFRDYSADDLVDITGFDINGVQESYDRVKVFVGPENDMLVFVGITSFDDITFVSDTLLG